MTHVHVNYMKFMSIALAENEVVESCDLIKLCANVCCSINEKKCMYGECLVFKNREIEYPTVMEGKANSQVAVPKWLSKTEEKKIEKPNGEVQTITVQVTVKEKKVLTLHQLLQEANALLRGKFCRHIFNISHQYTAVKEMKSALSGSDCLVHVDFSENYACKLAEEVQGMHFGASRHQVSLHTGMVYT